LTPDADVTHLLAKLTSVTQVIRVVVYRDQIALLARILLRELLCIREELDDVAYQHFGLLRLRRGQSAHSGL